MPVWISGFVLRTLELLVFFPPEHHVHRVRARTVTAAPPAHLTESNATFPVERNVVTTTPTALATPVPEPVPPGNSLAKFWWTLSLWWSCRGIGWNFAPTLAWLQRPPYLPGSSRCAFYLASLRRLVLELALLDFIDLYTRRLEPAFFVGPNRPAYASLTTGQRARYSIVTVARIFAQADNAHVISGMVCVALGWAMRWTGEWWEPQGWPPMFGSLGDVWRQPGLAHMWSRTWHQQYRRTLHTLCWIGIGENLLGLKHTGEAPHPRPATPLTSESSALLVASPIPALGSSRATADTTASPSISARSLPANLVLLTTRSTPLKLYAHNFIKSSLVFVVSGLMHDAGSLVLAIRAAGRGAAPGWTDVFVLTPFFAVQPIGLVVEALARRAWRRVRPATGARFVTLERAVGFAWTWAWLGYTAAAFVEGVARLGVWDSVEPVRGVSAWLVYGKWTV
ncbi:hypothetical protein Q5752_006991 [Cryptotrichosporon argae]